jgi:dihydrofolate synthase/folylpolyglutamate synthase
MKMGLRNIRVLLHAAGNPERNYPTVHVAGTNGKGSTCSFIASIAIEAGLRTGLYTSPHLIRFTERIRINGREIPESRLAGYVERLRPVIESTKATFFEATTCIAFLYFSDEHVDLAVVETGLGGRLDATNLVSPLVTVITNISLEHTDVLGNSIRSIAREKGGILKRGVPCLTASKDPVVLRTLRAIARRKGCTLVPVSRVVTVESRRPATRGNAMRLRRRGKRGLLVHAGLAGDHQRENVALAVAAATLLGDQRRGFRFSGRAIQRGLANVVRNSGIRARFESAGTGRIILDVAHNPGGVRVLVNTLGQRKGEFVVVFGVMKDKDFRGMAADLARVASSFVSVQPATSRALPEVVLRRELRRLGRPVIRGGSVAAGLAVASGLAGRRERILVTGSHYVVGEAIEAMNSGRA